MTNRIDNLRKLLDDRIVLLDGAWGVLIQREVRGEQAYRGERFRDHERDVAGDPDLLNLTKPELILDIHRRYFAAGAHIATTNTFTATRIGQADYALEDVAAEMSLEGARLSRGAARRVRGRGGRSRRAPHGAPPPPPPPPGPPPPPPTPHPGSR